MSKNNLCITGLSRQFIDKICIELAARLDMFYANMQALYEYEIMDREKVEAICGLEYLLKEEKSIVKRICGYDNTLINIEFASLNNESILDIIKDSCLLIYLRVDEKRYSENQINEGISFDLKMINREVFNDRDQICIKNADIIVECMDKKSEDIISDTIEKILKFYTEKE